MKATRKYLQQYAETEVSAFADHFKPQQDYHHVLVIPVFNEPENSLSALLAEISLPSPLLIILVINTPKSKNSVNIDSDAIENTLAFQQHLLTAYSTKWQSPDKQFALMEYTHKIDLLIIDRCSEGRQIPEHEGVGLARKIGCDIACWLIEQKQVRSPWIYNTDADVTLPADYFTAKIDPDHSAALYPFHHVCEDKKANLAMALYELKLHYYVCGLAWAGSPYSYHTLGSILVINQRHYAQSRGFPKRNAAEDFYLLNKLNKIAPVQSLNRPIIQLAGRASERVPFGTGPALTKLMSQTDPASEFHYYDARIFTLLKYWLSSFELLWQQRNSLCGNDIYKKLGELIGSGDDMDMDMDMDQDHSAKTLSALQQLEAGKAILHAIEHSQTEQAFCRHLHIWFDAFRTLKFIHLLRDQGMSSKPFEETLPTAPFIGNLENLDQWQRSAIETCCTRISAAMK